MNIEKRHIYIGVSVVFLILIISMTMMQRDTVQTNVEDESKTLTGGVITGGAIVKEGAIEEKSDNPMVLFKTTEGDFTIKLYPKEAPITVTNFLQYVNEGTYTDTVFHRVIPEFMVQGGGFISDGTQKTTKDSIKLESNNGLPNKMGTVAMARTMVPDSATNQFFINVADNDFLNYNSQNPGYAVFGEIIDGIETVKKIEAAQTTVKNGMPDWPVKDITILSAEIL